MRRTWSANSMQSVLPIYWRRALADTSPVARSVEPRSIMRLAAEAGFLDLPSRPSGLVLAAGSGFLAYVPKFVLGGLLLYSGLYLLYRWLLDSWRYLSFVEYISLAGIAVIIVEWGFIAGVLIGIVVGLATFALSVSRVHAIKFSFDGSEYHSSLDRRPDELALLAEYGREIQGMFLHSYLFFGSANRLHQHVKALL